MNTIEQLRPEPRRLDPEWSATTLASILATPTKATAPTARSRRFRIVAAGLVGAGVLGTGAAYAGGLVPQFVTDAFDRLDAQSGEQFDVTGVKPIADFVVPDGTRYTVWRGQNAAGGSCEAIQEDRPGTDNDNFGVGCFSGDSNDHYEEVSFGWTQLTEAEGEAQNPMYYLAYGESPTAAATTVRITGNGADVTLPIDHVTGGFGGNLPELVAPEVGIVDLTYSFRDADGTEIATRTTR